MTPSPPLPPTHHPPASRPLRFFNEIEADGILLRSGSFSRDRFKEGLPHEILSEDLKKDPVYVMVYLVSVLKLTLISMATSPY